MKKEQPLQSISENSQNLMCKHNDFSFFQKSTVNSNKNVKI